MKIFQSGITSPLLSIELGYSQTQIKNVIFHLPAPTVDYCYENATLRTQKTQFLDVQLTFALQ
jgi:hypothetical protein